MPTLASILSGIGTALGVGGQIYSGNRLDAAGEKTAEAYKKQGESALVVADWNARQFERRADQIRKQGEQIAKQGVAEENDARQDTAQLISAQRAGYAANGVMIDRGTPAAMQISSARQGEVDALRIRDNYRNQWEANAFEADQALEQARITREEGRMARDSAYNFAEAAREEGENARDAANINALTSLVSSPVASKWLADLIGGGASAAAGGAGSAASGGGAATTGGLMGNVWTGLQAVGATVVGGYVGQEVGEEVTGRQKGSNWGAGIGGAVGTWIGGPVGAAIGSAIGGFIDSAFGSRTYSYNSGFFLQDLPAVQNDGDRQKFEVEAFASGLKPVGFARRTTKDEAMAVIEPYRALDKAVVDIGKEFGKTITSQYVTGYDENGQNNGVFLGSAKEAGESHGIPVAQQLDTYATQLIQSLDGQISQAGLQSILSAQTTEEKLVKMRQVLQAESAA